MSWKPFLFGPVDLITIDEEVASGSGLVYSTNPRTALDSDGGTYFVKGPDAEVVFAELAGCVLANSVGLTVPCAKACSFADQTFAGTKMVSSIRAIEPYLRRREKVSNYGEVFDAIVVDVWLANSDRNMGNIVGSPTDDGVMEFVFIDFEKSAALRQFPITRSTMVEPHSLWPSDQLGQLLRDQKPLTVPTRLLQSIEQVDENACNLLLRPVSQALGGIQWTGDCAAAVARRAKEIRRLAEEVWTCS